MSEPAQPARMVVSGLAGFTQAAAQVAASARMELLLFTQEMDRRVYSEDAFLVPLKNFLLSHRRARLRCLIHTPRAAMRSGHRLVELARTLSSRIECRALNEDRLKMREEYLIADEHHLLIRSQPGDLEARHYIQSPLDVRDQHKIFETVWQESSPARELSELRI